MSLVQLPVVYCDESGQTGEDLLNLAQPVFTVAGVHLDDGVAHDLVNDARLNNFTEWKFKRLRQSGNGRRAILRVLEALTSREAKWSGAHKRFVVVAKIVDQLLEPLMHEAGIDIYDRGGQNVVANAWFQAIPDALGPTRTEQLFQSFVTMHQERTDAAIDEFFRFLAQFGGEATGSVAEELSVLLDAREVAASLLVGPSAVPRDEIDPQVSMPIALLDGWGNKLQEPFRVVFDESPVIRDWLPKLEPLLFSDMPKTTIGYGERSFTLPLWAASISFGESTEHPQIQIADIVAGASAYLLKGTIETPDDERFHQTLQELNLLSMLTLAVWPEIGAVPDRRDARVPGQLDPATAAADFVTQWHSRRR